MPQKPEDLGQIPFTTLAGSSYSNFLKVCNGRQIDPEFRRKYRLSKAVSFVMGPLRLWENLRFTKRIGNYQMPEAPVFIIGHWRSGTTFLHNLLAQDQQFAFCTTFQGTFPNILLCHQWWFKPILRKLMPDKRPADGVLLDADFPQEEDFALGNTISHTPYNAWYFPQDLDEYLHQGIVRDRETDEQRLAFLRAYRRLAAKAMLNPVFKKRKQRPGRFLSKNPPHTARIDLLLKLYPNAKFIYLERDPADTIASFIKFVEGVLPGLQFQRIDPPQLEGALTGLFVEIRKAYLKGRGRIPQNNLLELHYDELIKDPMGTVRRIYDQFELPTTKEGKLAMTDYLQKNAGHQAKSYEHYPQFRRKVEKALGTLEQAATSRT